MFTHRIELPRPASLGTSLCCITPVLALLGGASGLATSFSWIEPYRPYFIGATILIFGYAWYQKLKPQKQIDYNCETDNKILFWHTKKFLGMITISVVLLVAFPYFAKDFTQNRITQILWVRNP